MLQRMLVILCVAGAGFAMQAGEALKVWEVAKAGKVVPGAPKASDVVFRNLRPHPVNKRDPYDTFQAIKDFHITRLEWTYDLNRAFVQKAKAMGVTVGGALSDAEEDAQGSMLFGRVTGKDGQLKTHPWFHTGRWVGCANAPEFREAWLHQAKKYADAGVDLMQQDDPQMSTRCTSLCYCKYCKTAFQDYTKKHGDKANYEQFQKDSILAFHREMHSRLNEHAGRYIPFSHNNLNGFHIKLDWTAPAFDFVNCEIEGDNIHPAKLHKIVSSGEGLPMIFQYRETSVSKNRKAFAACYAMGTVMMVPWDIYMPNNAPRYFGNPADYADLSGFVRANGSYLEGYEEAAVFGNGVNEPNYGPDLPVSIKDGSKEVYAFVRALADKKDAPIAVHLVEWSDSPKPFQVRLRTASFSNGSSLSVSLKIPAVYDAEQHRSANQQNSFTSLSKSTAPSVKVEGEFTVVSIPALQPWGILMVKSEQTESKNNSSVNEGVF